MNKIMSNSPEHSVGTDGLWEKPTFELDISVQHVSLEWIQSLPLELKDTALYRLCRAVESKPTLVELFTLNQVIYRTISGGKFTESAVNVAARTGCDRKTVLKGLSLAVEQNILSENKRPGRSNEYSFKPVEEWLPQPLQVRQSPTVGNPPSPDGDAPQTVLDSPVVLNRDIRNNKIVEFPSSQDCTQAQSDENVGVVRLADYHIVDTNTVVVLKDLETTTTEVSVPVEDTPKNSHWKYVGQGLPRVYLPPELDSDTGMKIESIHEATKEPRQFIIKNAVELLYDRLNGIPLVAVEKPAALTALSAVAIPPASVPSIVQKSSDIPTDEALANAMRELRRLRIKDNATVRNMIKKLWHNFQGAYESIKQRMERREPFVNITGAFVNALKNGDKPEVTVVAEQVLIPQPNIDEPTALEMALIDEAIANGRAKDKYCGSLGWLVIENNGHAAPWQQFLTILKEGHQ